MRPPRTLSFLKTHLRADRIVDPHGLKPRQSIVGLLLLKVSLSTAGKWMDIVANVNTPINPVYRRVFRATVSSFKSLDHSDVFALRPGFAALQAFAVPKPLVTASAFLALIAAHAAAVFATISDTSTFTATLCSLTLTSHECSSLCFCYVPST